MELVLEIERWSGIWPECVPLMKAHASEVRGGSDDRVPFELDLERIRAIDRADFLVIVSAREPTEFHLVGYCIWFLTPSLESLGLLVATQSAWYLAEPFRGAGRALKIWNRSIEELKKRGVKMAYPHHWNDGAGAKIGKFFERQGAVRREIGYELWIGDK